MGAFDQAGDVGHHKSPVTGKLHDAQVGVQRSEGISGHLRMGAADLIEEGRLAGVGPADQADVGDQLQLKLEGAFLARFPLLGVATKTIKYLFKLQI